MNQHSKYVGHRSFLSQVIVQSHKQTHSKTYCFTWTVYYIVCYVCAMQYTAVRMSKLCSNLATGSNVMAISWKWVVREAVTSGG